MDVAKNESYYIGDFRVLADSLKTIRANLMNVMGDISGIASQVNAEAGQVSAGVQTLSQGTMEQSASIEGLVTNVTEITSQIKDSAVQCGNASELVDKANGYAVEASRAGAAGKGFLVVANEVRSLAAKSGEAAKNTGVLIGRSVQDVKAGTESTDHVVSAMQVINDCIQSIKTLMDDIAAASFQQSQMIAAVEEGIKEISKVVQTNSAAAEESAVVSRELSEQADTLNRLIGQFRIR